MGRVELCIELSIRIILADVLRLQVVSESYLERLLDSLLAR
jgi:hypothetical protein